MERRRIGLALAGGGPAGAIYEIGALHALETAIDGLDLNDVDIYVGVSAGGFVTAMLANGMTTSALARVALGHDGHDGHDHGFEPGVFFRPNLGEYLRRGLALPRHVVEACQSLLVGPRDASLGSAAMRLARSLPVGLFDNEPIRAYLAELFGAESRTDDFRELKRTLRLVAADLDSGEAVRFGEPGRDHVPISTAVQASCALPGLYPPVAIDGRDYVDGVLLKTMHASVALERGAELVLCLNPLVPVDTRDAVATGAMRRGRLVHRGLPTVLVQTFRTLVHSRLEAGLASYEPRFPGQEVLLIEPRRQDYRMFFTNVFSFAARRDVCAHGYRETMRLLGERREELGPLLARHGLTLRTDVLDGSGHETWPAAAPPVGAAVGGSEVAANLGRALDRLESALAAGAGRRPAGAGDTR